MGQEMKFGGSVTKVGDEFGGTLPFGGDGTEGNLRFGGSLAERLPWT